MNPVRPIGSLARKIFSATVRFSTVDSSWYMMLIPSARACTKLWISTARPSIQMVPPGSAGNTPVRIFISVLLPAPFSPHNACTSPREISRLTLSSALTPGNVFEIFRISKYGFMVCGPSACLKWTGLSDGKSCSARLPKGL